MRTLGTVGLFIGIFGALFGLAYSAFVLLREGTFLAEQSLSASGASAVRVPATAARPYWAEIELAGAPRDLAMKARVVDPSGEELRAFELRAEADPRARTRIAPVVAKTSGELTYEIEIPPAAGVQGAKLIVYRSSREEVLAGLIGAAIAIAVGGIVFRVSRVIRSRQ